MYDQMIEKTRLQNFTVLRQVSELIYGIILTFFNRDFYGQPLMGIPIAQLV